jgi:hypothetical protein
MDMRPAIDPRIKYPNPIKITIANSALYERDFSQMCISNFTRLDYMIK